MPHAALLGRASKIASGIYKALPRDFRQQWMYRSFTGEAVQLLKAGKTDEEVSLQLRKTYVEVKYVRPLPKLKI
jgi:hypothetical protein